MLLFYFAGLFLSIAAVFFVAGLHDVDYDDLIGFLFISLLWPIVAVVGALLIIFIPIYFLMTGMLLFSRLKVSGF